MIAGAMLAAAMTAGGARAAVIFDPIQMAIGPGLRAGLMPFVTAPPTGRADRLAPIQSMRALNDGTGRLFVNDLNGTVSMTNVAGAAPRTWFDIRNEGVGFAAINDQAGLVSIAFHPNFNGDSRRAGYGVFYTIYTTEASAGTATLAGNGPVNHHDVLREWRVADPAAPAADIVASREVLRMAQPRGDHGPGTISFNTSAAPGSSDYGRLYIGLGDGGGAYDPDDNAQDLKSPFGKILRIDPADPDGAGPRTYGIPADNPYAARGDALGEVWASGLRNPQQFGWDNLTGTMIVTDIGQAQIEEINVGRAGANYGWPIREGTFGASPDRSWDVVTDDPNTGGYAEPIAQYDHDEGAAIGGAILYRGTALPELVGQMLVADLVNGRLFHFTPGDTTGEGGLPLLRELLLSLNGDPTTLLALEGPRRVDLRLGLDAAGEVYLLTKGDGDIYRLVAAVPEPAAWAMMIAGFGIVGAALRRRPGGRRATA